MPLGPMAIPIAMEQCPSPISSHWHQILAKAMQARQRPEHPTQCSFHPQRSELAKHIIGVTPGPEGGRQRPAGGLSDHRCILRVYTHHSIKHRGTAAQATIHHHNSRRDLLPAALMASPAPPGTSGTGSRLLSLSSSRFTAMWSYCGIGG